MKVYKSKYRWKNDGNDRGVPLHTVIAEKALGKKLPPRAEVHHIDRNGHNNHPSNLVICPSHAYHMLLHIRAAALEACGNADWLKCVRCGKYDDPRKMALYTPKDQTSPRAEHRECRRKCGAERRVA